MSLERFCIKFFTRTGIDIEDAVFIDIFHKWIRLKKLDGVLLDVADYRHVPEGPSVMLISHEINYALDYAEGRFGLFAQRKIGGGAAHRAGLLELIRSTVALGALLEADPRLDGRLKLEAGRFYYMSNDRLLAPNTAEAFNRLKPDLQAAAGLVYPDQAVTVARVANDVRDRLTIAVDSGQPLDISALVEPVGAAA